MGFGALCKGVVALCRAFRVRVESRETMTKAQKCLLEARPHNHLLKDHVGGVLPSTRASLLE
jgi:hypothetical protein